MGDGLIVSLMGVAHGLHATTPPGSGSPPAHLPTMRGCCGVGAAGCLPIPTPFFIAVHSPPPRSSPRRGSRRCPSQCIYPWRHSPRSLSPASSLWRNHWRGREFLIGVESVASPNGAATLLWADKHRCVDRFLSLLAPASRQEGTKIAIFPTGGKTADPPSQTGRGTSREESSIRRHRPSRRHRSPAQDQLFGKQALHTLGAEPNDEPRTRPHC